MKSFSYKNFNESDPHLHVIFERAIPEEKHTHDFIEIVYVNSGKMLQEIDGQKFETGKGDLLFINYNCVHSFDPVGDASYYNICFYPETMEKIINEENAFSLLSLSAFNEISKDTDSGIVTFSPKEQKKIEYLLETMVHEQAERGPRFEEVNQSLLNVLINWILRKTSIPDNLEEPGLRDDIADYIENNLDADLSLGSLAKKCFYNPSYFSRLFKNKFRVPLVEYVATRRVNKAIQLLTETELSVDAISSNCGFSNKTAFYRAFSKITGKTPAEYRNNKSK